MDKTVTQRFNLDICQPPDPTFCHTLTNKMTMAANDHDEINLQRLVRRLEKSSSDPEWTVSSDDTWIKAQGTLQVMHLDTPTNICLNASRK
jgi:hypothetical protein